MNKKIRVLGIAPYENMKTLMEDLAVEYPQIELSLFVGDREHGLEIAKQNFHGNYDIVISRGGTSKMLKEKLDLPVIDIEVTTYDLLCSLRVSEGMDKRIRLVCTENIVPGAKRIKELMNLKMEICTYKEKNDVESAILKGNREDYDVLLCDTAAYTAAKTMGLNVYLIISGIDNIRNAFNQAVLIGQSQARLSDENIFLRELLNRQIGYTTILDDDGNIYLSTMNVTESEILKIFKKELPECIKAGQRRIIRSINGVIYKIRTNRINIGDLSYTAFFYDVRRTPLSGKHTGIAPFSRPEVEDRYCKSVFSISGFVNDAHKDIEMLSLGSLPVIILGENGSGKESAADIIYLNSPLKNNPLVRVNCAVMSEKEWDFLFLHHNSPLADEGSTIYFANTDALSMDLCRKLVEILLEMRVCSRNRVFFSCDCKEEETMPRPTVEILETLNCLTIKLPSLREISDRIPDMINMYISHLNENAKTPLLGIESEAVELLQKYSWPHNFTQFSRLMNELASMASNQIITEDCVQSLLQKERHLGYFLPREEDENIALDISRTLSEINHDIIRRVVDESDGNQSIAAKRLGISRTTLWRILRKE